MDPLTILIEADASGLQTQLNSGMNLIKKFVSDMNSQQINWETILAGSLDLAIISGIAATFAQAISQEVQFQSAALNLNNINTAPALATASGAPNADAFNEAIASGASLADSTAAIESFSKAGLDSAASLQATTDAAGIARDTGESMGAVVQELSTLFQSWGVTSTPQVTAALTGLTNAAQNGNLTFDQLVSTLSQQGGNLSAVTNISDTAVSLAELSKQSGMTQAAVIDSFNAIASAVTDKTSGLNVLTGGIGSISTAISSGPTGLVTAFKSIKSELDAVGPQLSGVIGQQMGLSTQDVGSFSDTSVKQLDAVSAAALKLDQKLTPIDSLLKAQEPDAAKLGVAWNNLVTEFDKFVIPTGLTLLTVALNGIDSILKDIATVAKTVGSSNLFSAALSLAGGGIGGLASAAGSLLGGILDNSIANRNNNPGDLRYAGQAGATQNSNGFAQFSSFSAGFTALQNQLSLDISRSGSDTLAQFAAKYAPASDGNNPQQYAQELATQLHTTVGTPISSLSASIQQFAVAIAHNEDSNNPNLAQFSGSNGGSTTNNISLSSTVNGGGQSASSSLYNQFMGLVTLLHL